MKVYISGPITGTHDAWDRFDTMARRVKKYGHDAINPYYIGEAFPDGTHLQIMAVCLTLMSFADAILLMDGWEDSEGARQEYRKALAMGIPIFFDIEDLRRESGK